MMNDNEIVKALECCGNIVDSTCKKCVYHETYNASCVVRLMRDALDLINRQKAEIERLQEEIEIKSQKRANIFEITDAYERGRNKGIKEFADRLKELPSVKNSEYEWFHLDIDNLLKEMEVENND